MNAETKQGKVLTTKNHSFYYLGLEIREDTTLSLTYEYTPLIVKLTTSTQIDSTTGKFFLLYLIVKQLCYIINKYFFDCMIYPCFFNRRQRFKIN